MPHLWSGGYDITSNIHLQKAHKGKIDIKKEDYRNGNKIELSPMLRNAKTVQALYEFFKPQVFSRVMTSGHPVQP